MLAAATDNVWPAHALFDGFAEYRGTGVALSVDALCALARSAQGKAVPRFAAQTPELLADGLHYEERVARLGIVATREGNTHDLFNALVWMQHTDLKRAMNARQVADIVRVGPKQRTRGQCALTHFDEAGAIVWIADDAGLRAWDAHDWHGLFLAGRKAWGSRIAVTVIGHALFDYVLVHGELPVAKALAVRVSDADVVARAHDAAVAAWPAAECAVASEIAAGRLLCDPQELRPLPLAGIPCGSANVPSETFLATAPCFRPLRPGRRYPEPFAWSAGGSCDEVESAGLQTPAG